MAEYLSKKAKCTGLCLMLFAAANACNAQALSDPTRPPESMGLRQDQDQLSGKNAAGPELQSVLISTTRRVAIINGQSIKLGEKFGEARVVKISENEVVLRNGSDVQVLKLFPNMEKQTTSRRSGAKVDSRRQ